MPVGITSFSLFSEINCNFQHVPKLLPLFILLTLFFIVTSWNS